MHQKIINFQKIVHFMKKKAGNVSIVFYLILSESRARNQNVCGLEVAMDDVTGMKVGDGIGCLACYGHAVMPGEGVGGGEEGEGSLLAKEGGGGNSGTWKDATAGEDGAGRHGTSDVETAPRSLLDH